MDSHAASTHGLWLGRLSGVPWPSAVVEDGSEEKLQEILTAQAVMSGYLTEDR